MTLRSYPAGTRYALAAVILIAALPALSAPTPRQLEDAYFDANLHCQGASDPDSAGARKACQSRTDLSAQLASVGYCFGRYGQSEKQYAWHRCGRGSLHPTAD